MPVAVVSCERSPLNMTIYDPFSRKECHFFLKNAGAVTFFSILHSITICTCCMGSQKGSSLCSSRILHIHGVKHV